MVIMSIGYMIGHGFYLPDGMQVFNRGQKDRAYWCNRGWNAPGTLARGLVS